MCVCVFVCMYETCFIQKLVDERLQKVDKLVIKQSTTRKRSRTTRSKTHSININIQLIFTEPYSSCSQKLEHFPNQQKSTAVVL